MNFGKFRRALIAATLLVCSACQDGSSPFTSSTASAPKLPTETRVFYGFDGCAFDGLRAENPILVALAVAAIPALISAGTGVIGDFLQAQAEPKPATAQASINLFVENGAFPICVQVIRGQFRKSEFDLKQSTVPATPSWFAEQMAKAKRDDGKPMAAGDADRSWRALSITLSRSGLELAAWPEAMMELYARRATAGGAMAWAPTFISFDEPIETHTLRSDSRNQSLTISLFTPGKKELMSIVNFGEIKPGTRSYYNAAAIEHLRKLKTAHDFSAQLPPEQKVSTGQLNSAVLRNEAPWTVHEVETNGPATIKVVVTETKDKNEFFAILAKLFQAGKGTIEKSAGDYAIGLLPKQPDLPKEAAAAKTYATDYNAALAGLNECAQLSTPADDDMAGKVALATKMRSVYALQLAANISSRSASNTDIFSAGDMITPGKKPSDCKTALDNAVKLTLKN